MTDIKDLTEEVLARFEEELIENFDDGQEISHEWLKAKFGIIRPSFKDLGYDIDEYVKVLDNLQFVYMSAIDKLRQDLLKNKQCYLCSVWGRGYKILPKEEQSKYGYDQMVKKLKETIKEGVAIISNVRPLPMMEQSKHYDLLAKAEQIREVFKNIK